MVYPSRKTTIYAIAALFSVPIQAETKQIAQTTLPEAYFDGALLLSAYNCGKILRDHHFLPVIRNKEAKIQGVEQRCGSGHLNLWSLGDTNLSDPG